MTLEQTISAVTAESLLSATDKYSNKDDANRVYDISANVRIENGNVNNFENGTVKKHFDESDGMQDAGNLASFNTYSERNLNLYIHNADETEAKSILESVYAFITDVRTSVIANPVTA